jgi:hypothetical protein
LLPTGTATDTAMRSPAGMWQSGRPPQSMSASGITIRWFLRRRSTAHALAVGAAGRIDVFGDRGGATKPIAMTRGSVNSVSTASLSPLTALRMPAGARLDHPVRRPHRHRGSRSDGEDEGVAQAIAGANFHIGIMAGKLNGVMPATTPSG